MTSAIQLNFSLRTSSNCKTVHLLGSWDTYRNPLPLSKDTSKSGGWKGTFRFQDSVLKQGERYWYYYIIDGYHVSHDPAREFVTEPTTGRKLNVLNIPKATGAQPAPSTRASKRHSRVSSTTCAKGRPLSVSEIRSPMPRKPELQTRQIRTEQFSLDQLSAKLAASQLAEEDESESESEDDSDDDSDIESGSDVSSNVPSLMSRGSGASSPSSVSSNSSCCTCNTYGLTRAGTRVKLDCGGRKCSYSDGSDCSSDEEEEYCPGPTRRHGIVMKH